MGRLSDSKHLRVAVILAVMVGASLWLLFVLPEQLWWAEHKDMKLISAVSQIRWRLADLEWGSQTSLRSDKQLSKMVSGLGEVCAQLGHPAARAGYVPSSVSAHGTTAAPVLTMQATGGHDLVIFYAGGRIGVSRSVLTRDPESLRSEIIVLPPV